MSVCLPRGTPRVRVASLRACAFAQTLAPEEGLPVADLVGPARWLVIEARKTVLTYAASRTYCRLATKEGVTLR